MFDVIDHSSGTKITLIWYRHE